MRNAGGLAKARTRAIFGRWLRTVALVVLPLLQPDGSAACTLCPVPVDPLRALVTSGDADPGEPAVPRVSSTIHDVLLSSPDENPEPADPALPGEEGFGPKFRRAWVPITCGEVALLGITAALPKSWTGWSARFVQDGTDNFKEAWTKPPVMDTDAWFHNYIGHPYGGSLYYNSVRSQGATVAQSFLTSAVLSVQWEYIFEAVAERPSIQDLVITPVVGSALGEVIHRTTARMRRNGTTVFEKAFIVVLNPAGAILGTR